MFNQQQDLEFQQEHSLPELASNINRDVEDSQAGHWAQVANGAILAQSKHLFDPRCNYADRSIAVRRIILGYARLALVNTGLTFEEAANYALASEVHKVMTAQGYIFEGRGVLAI